MKAQKRLSNRRVYLSLILFGLMRVEPVSAFTQGVCGQTITSSVTLTQDITGCTGPGIIIGANNITLDGAGHSITGTFPSDQRGPDRGIELFNPVSPFDRTGVTVKNCVISGFRTGISLLLASGNTIDSNTVTGCVTGIGLTRQSNSNGIIKND